MQFYSLQQEDTVKRLESIVSSEPEVPHFFLTSLENGVHGLCLTGFPGDNTSSLYRYGSKALHSLTLSPGLYPLATSPEHAFLSIWISVLCWDRKPFPSWRQLPPCSLLKRNSQPGWHPKCCVNAWLLCAQTGTTRGLETAPGSACHTLPLDVMGVQGSVHSFIPCSGFVGDDLRMHRTGHRTFAI